MISVEVSQQFWKNVRVGEIVDSAATAVVSVAKAIALRYERRRKSTVWA